MQSLSPNIFVNDVNATIDFYKILGFETQMTVPDDGSGPLVWAMLNNGGVSIMLQSMESLGDDLPQISRTSGGSLLLYISVDDINSLFEQVKDKVTILKGLETTFYGATEFTILDNNNYVLTFAQHSHDQA
ncbi:glyoxalase [Mucilaginibacter pallidiroseus]|uniref:Glyoxalase n=1 Tax=Mucilaginibacter pallidiroseus TaxID=2599295 RepID=A0A563UEA6_9SPHI|nr:VOC family protein [Mucilaginibacter pallidiroseus]TWR29690.1 glyoxalase [Mucilaginibacter pallidiroseus]